jgi:uncharacterized protein with von Willebrand factor type A (vWA) domain
MNTPALPLADRQADPLAAMAGFAAHLREHGFVVGVAEQQAMLEAVRRLPDALRRPARVGEAWRAIACHGARDWRRWPELYEHYWHPHRATGSTRVSGRTRPGRDIRQLVQQLQDSLGDGGTRPGPAASDTALADTAAEGDTLNRHQGGASRTEALHDRSLHEWLPQDLALLQQLAERIAARLRRRLTRRWHAHPQGRRLDVRHTLRASLATGGVPLAPAWRQPRRERPRLFVLVDVSRSMETHAQLFLRIARAFVGAAQARVFVFHTRLAEVTPLLQRDSGAVQEKVNAVTAGFAGGTRIATSLDDFHRVHARAQLGRRAQVWVLSDGFDADEPHRLAEALAAVRGRGARITWFHPSPDVPASAALQAARAQVQRFVRLASLRDLSHAADLID